MNAIFNSSQRSGDAVLVANGRGDAVASRSLPHLAMGTMVSTDLGAARRMYEAFFGLECVAYTSGRMMVRDRRSKWMMEHGERDFFVIDVEEVPEIKNPQGTFNHWGFSVSSREEVDRIHALVRSKMEEFRIKRSLPITPIHNAYGFFFVDYDSNWWEVEFRGGSTNNGYFSRGSYGVELVDPPFIDPELPIAATRSAVVGPEAFMTHGTTDVASLAAASSFYEDILGLRSVQHAKIAQFTAGGGDFAFVGVETGKRNIPQAQANRWILLVDDDEALAVIYQRALRAREALSIAEITDLEAKPLGYRSFLLCNSDYNWFEISTRSAKDLLETFERGDAAS